MIASLVLVDSNLKAECQGLPKAFLNYRGLLRLEVCSVLRKIRHAYKVRKLFQFDKA